MSNDSHESLAPPLSERAVLAAAERVEYPAPEWTPPPPRDDPYSRHTIVWGLRFKRREPLFWRLRNGARLVENCPILERAFGASRRAMRRLTFWTTMAGLLNVALIMLWLAGPAYEFVAALAMLFYIFALVVLLPLLPAVALARRLRADRHTLTVQQFQLDWLVVPGLPQPFHAYYLWAVLRPFTRFHIAFLRTVLLSTMPLFMLTAMIQTVNNPTPGMPPHDPGTIVMGTVVGSLFFALAFGLWAHLVGLALIWLVVFVEAPLGRATSGVLGIGMGAVELPDDIERYWLLEEQELPPATSRWRERLRTLLDLAQRWGAFFFFLGCAGLTLWPHFWDMLPPSRLTTALANALPFLFLFFFAMAFYFLAGGFRRLRAARRRPAE